MEKEKMRGESPEKSLEAFREEMRRIRDEEKQGIRKTGHFTGYKNLGVPELNPEKLAERDLEIWQKYESGALTHEELQEYRKYNNERNLQDSDTLAQYIANKMQIAELEAAVAKLPPRKSEDK